jgi:hypothetical protein
MTTTNGTSPSKSQSTQSSDVVDTVESQNDNVVIVKADNVLTLAEQRKLAEKYLMARLCTSREFDFMAMCDDQSHPPFCCDINEPSQTTQSGHSVDMVEPRNDEPRNDVAPVFDLELPKWGTPEYWRLFQTT